MLPAIFKIAHNCSRIRSEDQFLYAKFCAPLLLVSALSLRLLWQRHWSLASDIFSSRPRTLCSRLYL